MTVGNVQFRPTGDNDNQAPDVSWGNGKSHLVRGDGQRRSRERRHRQLPDGMPMKPDIHAAGELPHHRREDLRLVTGRGHYAVDLDLPHTARAVMVRSPHAHAAIRGMDFAACAGASRRAGGSLRRRCARRWAAGDTACDGEFEVRVGHAARPSRWVRAPRHQAAAAADRARPLCRRGRRHGGRRDPRPGAGCGRGGRDRLGAASGRDPCDRCAQGRCAAALGPRAGQSHARSASRRRGGDRSGLRPRRPPCASQELGAARHRRAYGAPCRGRRMGRDGRALHRPCLARDRRGADARRIGRRARCAQRSACG